MGRSGGKGRKEGRARRGQREEGVLKREERRDEERDEEGIRRGVRWKRHARGSREMIEDCEEEES